MNKIIDKISDWLASFFIISLYLFSNRSGYTFISNTIGVCFAGIILFEIIIIRRKIIIDTFNKIFFIFIIISLISTILSKNIEISYFICKVLVNIFIFTIILTNYVKNHNKIFIIINSFIGGAFFNSLIIISELNVNSAQRLGATLGNENIIGILISIGVVFSCYMIIFLKKFLYIPLAIISFIAVLLTGSRTSLIFCIIGIIFLLFCKVRKKIIKILLISICILIALIIFYKIVMSNDVLYYIIGRRIEGLLNIFVEGGNVDKSTLMRQDMIKKGIEIFKEKPLLGYGHKNYSLISGFNLYSHNNFIELLCSVGLIGIITYYSMYFLILIRLLKLKNQLKWPFIIINFIIFILGMSSVQYYQKYTYIILAVSYCIYDIERKYK